MRDEREEGRRGWVGVRGIGREINGKKTQTGLKYESEVVSMQPHMKNPHMQDGCIELVVSTLSRTRIISYDQSF